MTIEILYKEVCNLYGDIMNAEYLKQCLNEAEFIYTSIGDTPYFVNHDVDFIYMGPSSERFQKKVISLLFPYKDRIKELIDKDVIFLFTGNAFEVMGQYIIEPDGNKIKCLDILKMYSQQDLIHRHNSLDLGDYNGIKIVGYKSQFSKTFSKEPPFIDVKKGSGIDNACNFEGVHVNNFFGTYLLGPILILNPLFTKHIFKLLGYNGSLLYEKEMFDAYEKRLKEFQTKI